MPASLSSATSVRVLGLAIFPPSYLSLLLQLYIVYPHTIYSILLYRSLFSQPILSPLFCAGIFSEQTLLFDRLQGFRLRPSVQLPCPARKDTLRDATRPIVVAQSHCCVTAKSSRTRCSRATAIARCIDKGAEFCGLKIPPSSSRSRSELSATNPCWPAEGVS